MENLIGRKSQTSFVFCQSVFQMILTGWVKVITDKRLTYESERTNEKDEDVVDEWRVRNDTFLFNVIITSFFFHS